MLRIVVDPATRVDEHMQNAARILKCNRRRGPRVALGDYLAAPRAPRMLRIVVDPATRVDEHMQNAARILKWDWSSGSERRWRRGRWSGSAARSSAAAGRAAAVTSGLDRQRAS